MAGQGGDQGRGGKFAEALALEQRDPARACQIYDEILKVESDAREALAGRARMALARGEVDALARFDAALRRDPGNATLHLGKARALEAAGDLRGARIVAGQIAAQAPGFIEALEFLASLRLAAGESDFAAPFQKAAALRPKDPNIAAAHIAAFAGIGRANEAAAIAKTARSAFPNEPYFALQEAVQAGAAGDWQRAEAIWADLPLTGHARIIGEARHRLRGGQIERAQALISALHGRNAGDIAAWALQDLIWRLGSDDEAAKRARWLHGQEGLVQFLPLDAPSGLIERAARILSGLHDQAGQPLGQSLRGGSQTRGILFDRADAALAQLKATIEAVLDRYRAGLPLIDPDHPFLRHRHEAWQLAGSWSVRLRGPAKGQTRGDNHSAHIHPAGILSSALYLKVPTADGGDEGSGADNQPSEGKGQLELGRPPPDLALDLDPLRIFEPRAGYLALFPSTMYHGTTPISAACGGDRLTIAFDVELKKKN